MRASTPVSRLLESSFSSPEEPPPAALLEMCVSQGLGSVAFCVLVEATKALLDGRRKSPRMMMRRVGAVLFRPRSLQKMGQTG